MWFAETASCFRSLEDRCDAGVVVDRAGGGDAAGIGGTDDGIAAQRAIAEGAVERVVRVDIDIIGATRVLSTELRSRHGGAGKRAKHIPWLSVPYRPRLRGMRLERRQRPQLAPQRP